jgi:hypothetical protein
MQNKNAAAIKIVPTILEFWRLKIPGGSRAAKSQYTCSDESPLPISSKYSDIDRRRFFRKNQPKCQIADSTDAGPAWLRRQLGSR